MSTQGRQSDARVNDRLREWGIVEIVGDFRGAQLEQVHRLETTTTVTHVKHRSSFSAECLDCGQSPHVSPDDASMAVCLRCGRDRWL